jgi:hypothetical protein
MRGGFVFQRKLMMRAWVKTGLWIVMGCAWTGSVGVGGVMLFRYESEAGAAGRPATTMPEVAAMRGLKGARLVLSIHPRCACSRATIGELSRLMTACYGRLTATVFVIRPVGEKPGWEKTDLWASAARIPGVTVVADVGGVVAEKLGAETSGEAMLYDGSGKLIFSGGITESRGHSGDNAGESAIMELVLGAHEGGAGAPQVAVKTPVYGCSLFDPRTGTQLTGMQQGGVP